MINQITNSFFYSKNEKSLSLFQLSQLASEVKEKQNKNNSLTNLIKSTKIELSKNNQRFQKMSLNNNKVANKLKRIKHILKKDNKKLTSLNEILKGQILNQKLKYTDTLDKYYEIFENLNEKLENIQTINFIYINKIQEKKSNIHTLEKRLQQIKINSIFVSTDNYEIDADTADESQTKEILNYYSYSLLIQLKEFNKYENECKSLIKNKLILNRINFCKENKISYRDSINIPKKKIEFDSDSDSCFDDSEISELNFSNGNSFEVSSKSYGSDSIIKSTIVPKLDLKLIEYNKLKIKSEDLDTDNVKNSGSDENTEQDKIDKMKKKIKLMKIVNKKNCNKIKQFEEKINKMIILLSNKNTLVRNELK